MRILDENNIEIIEPDLSLGHLVEEEIFIVHHSAIDEEPEQWHYETIKEYPNGGKDIIKIIDKPYIEAKDAWDEYETIQRYILYTNEELEAIRNKENESTIEEKLAELKEQNDMLLQCILELSEVVYL